MNILFLHPNFPAQFRHLAFILGKDPRNKVVFGTTREEGELPCVRKIVYKPHRQATASTHHYVQPLENAVLHGQALYRIAEQLRSEDFIPDIVYGHSGWGPTMFVKDIFPNAQSLCYFEWFYHSNGSDVGFDPKMKIKRDTRSKIRMKNAPILTDLYSCDRGLAPTYWQQQQFPAEFRGKIKVIHDGIDTDFFTPKAEVKLILPSLNLDLTGIHEIVTYVARGMEPYRGFPEFMESVALLQRRRPKCHVVIVGIDDVFYSPLLADGKTYKQLMLEKLPFDLTRVHFAGHLSYPDYLLVLQASAVHVYLTYPFVLSWSMMEAMSTGCLLVASNTAPVTEIIRDGENGLLADFFSPEEIADRVGEVLDKPDLMKSIRAMARQTIMTNYSQTALIPQQLRWITGADTYRQGTKTMVAPDEQRPVASAINKAQTEIKQGASDDTEERDVSSKSLSSLIQKAEGHFAAGRLGDAEATCRRIITENAQSLLAAKAIFLLGMIEKKNRRSDAAIGMLTRAAELDQESAVYPFELGGLLQDIGRLEEALVMYDRALQYGPNLAPIHNNKGNVCKLLGRFQEAVACYKDAERLDPDSPEIHTNMGVALFDQRFLEKAESCYRKALSINADHASAHWNLGLLLLLKGDFVNGLPEYEWRWRVSNYAPFLPRHKTPRWQGEDISGRTLLLYAEQGLGDTLQYVRYAPLAAQRGCQVIVQCQPELVRLLRSSGTLGEIVAANKPYPVHDVHCSLMSLPFVFKTTLPAIPADIPYIHPTKKIVLEWKRRMTKTKGLRVGLVWAGKLWENIPAAKSVDHRRSLHLDALARFADTKNVTFYGLQMGEAAKQAHTSSRLKPIDIMNGVKDFTDTAAIIANLDLVISVDTSVAHIAGAMGKPVWVLSRYDGCWRWLLDREDSPWYPTLRLFRQTNPGDWEDVIERVAGELRRMC